MPTYKVTLRWDNCTIYETRTVEAESEEVIGARYAVTKGELFDEEVECVNPATILEIEEMPSSEP